MNTTERVRPKTLAALVLVLAASGCGSGADGEILVSLSVWGPAIKTTTDATITLAGDSFVPRGAGCYYYSGPWAPPGCLCELGDDVRLVWSNASNGQRGSFGPTGGDGASIGISGSGPGCAPSVWWRVPDIALSPGANLVDVTVSDGRVTGAIRVTVTRN